MDTITKSLENLVASMDMTAGKRRRARKSPAKRRTSHRRVNRKTATKRGRRSVPRKTRRRRFNLVGGGAPGALPTDLDSNLYDLAGLSADPSTRVVGAPAAAVEAANTSNSMAASIRPGTVRSA